MSKRIGVIIKEPGQKPKHVNISDSLENLQKWVGGYIECVTLDIGLVMIINEEGKIRDLPHNFYLLGDSIRGTAIFAGVEGEEFCDIPVSFQDFKQIFPELFEEDR